MPQHPLEEALIGGIENSMFLAVARPADGLRLSPVGYGADNEGHP
jgi:hypothetical protein